MGHTKPNPIVRALFNDDDVVLDAVKNLRADGYHVSEVYSPFPIHGLDDAMGLERTRLSTAAFFYGLAGLFFCSWLTWYTMIADWPQNIGGKPNEYWFLNLPSFIPVMFELTVFFAAHLMCWSYFAVNKLYPGAKAQNPDCRTTDDHFLMEVELEGKETDLNKKLQELGALEISKVEA